MKVKKLHRPPHIFEDNKNYFITGKTYFGFPHLREDKTKEYFLTKLCQLEEKLKFKLHGWVILNNHYHLLTYFPKGDLLSRLVQELHGSTSYFIRRINSATSVEPDFLREFYQGLTPFEQRQWRKLQRRLKSATPKSRGVAQFIARPSGIAKFTSRESPRITNFNSCLLHKLKSPPVWYQYLESIVRSERDFYCHLNYLHQNPIKHDYVRKMGTYRFSSYRDYLKEKGKEWLNGCLEKFPIREFQPKGSAD